MIANSRFAVDNITCIHRPAKANKKVVFYSKSFLNSGYMRLIKEGMLSQNSGLFQQLIA